MNNSLCSSAPPSKLAAPLNHPFFFMKYDKSSKLSSFTSFFPVSRTLRVRQPSFISYFYFLVQAGSVYCSIKFKRNLWISFVCYRDSFRYKWDFSTDISLFSIFWLLSGIYETTLLNFLDISWRDWRDLRVTVLISSKSLLSDLSVFCEYYLNILDPHPQLFFRSYIPESESPKWSSFCSLEKLKIFQIITSWFLFIYSFFSQFISFPLHFIISSKQKPGCFFIPWKSPQ